MGYYLGFDIGGTKCAVILGYLKEPETIEGIRDSEREISVLYRKEIPTEKNVPPLTILGRLAELSREALSENNVSSKELISAGISCGNPLNSRTGEILSPPNLPGWDRVPATAFLKEKLGVPVYLQNDANAGALAEWLYGAARGYKNVIFLTFGTGFGAGLILDGRLYSGTNDMAGEIGHVRIAEHGPVGYGKEGSMEGFCSGGGLNKLAQIKVCEQLQMGKKVSFFNGTEKELHSITAKDVASAAAEGDPVAVEIMDISAYYLGRGLSILIDLLNPEIIVIGSIYARNEDFFRDRVRAVIEKETLSLTSGVCRIVSAKLGERIGDLAALSVAMSGSP